MKLIAKTQAVGDGRGNFRFRHLYELPDKTLPITERRVSVPLTRWMDEHENTHDLESLIKLHSVESTGIYSDGIELTGYELFRISK